MTRPVHHVVRPRGRAVVAAAAPPLVLLLVAFSLPSLPAVADAGCPSKCLCFSTTVRCMFLHIDRIPDRISPATAVLWVTHVSVTRSSGRRCRSSPRYARRPPSTRPSMYLTANVRTRLPGPVRVRLKTRRAAKHCVSPYGTVCRDDFVDVRITNPRVNPTRDPDFVSTGVYRASSYRRVSTSRRDVLTF